MADLQVRATLLERAIGVLSTPDNRYIAEVQHAIGYAWYLHPDDTALRNESVTRHLRNALDIHPDHKFALLYLAHHHYDRRQFAEALDLLSTLKPAEFAAFDQPWRDSKVAELILCCTLRLGDSKNIGQAACRFCEALTCCDEGMNANPDELAETLVEQLTRLKIE